MRVRWLYWPSAEPGLAHRARQGPRSCVAHGAWVHQTERHRAAPPLSQLTQHNTAPRAQAVHRDAPLPPLLPLTPRDECGGSTWARAQRGTIARDLRRPHHPRAQHEPTCTSRILVEGRAMEKQRRKAARARPTTRARPAPVVIPVVDSPQWQVMLVTDDTIGNGPGATARDMQKVQRASKRVYSAAKKPGNSVRVVEATAAPIKRELSSDFCA